MVVARSQELQWLKVHGGIDWDGAIALSSAPDGRAFWATQGGPPFYGTNLFSNRVSWVAMQVSEVQADGALSLLVEMEGPEYVGPLLATADDGSLFVAGHYSQQLRCTVRQLLTNDLSYASFLLEARGTAPNWSPTDTFLLRFDSTGALRWHKSLGGGDHQTCFGLAVSQGSVVLAGGYRFWAEFPPLLHYNQGGGHWLGKFDSTNGNAIWLKSIAFTNYYEGPRIAADRQGNIVVVGAFVGELAVESSRLTTAERDLYFAKFSPEGVLLWLKQARSDAHEYVNDLVVDSSGNIYVAIDTLFNGAGTPFQFEPDLTVNGPSLLVKLDPEGAALWALPEAFDALAMAPDDSLLALGQIAPSRTLGPFSFTAAGRRDTLVARFDPSGQPVWARAVPDTAAGVDLAVTPQGAIYLTGDAGTPVFGGGDTYLARYEAAGPEIIAQPADVTLVEGGNAQFSIQVKDPASATFQWRRNGVDLADGDRVSGVRSSVLNIASVGRADEADYSVRVQAGGATVFSSSARLRVLAPIQFTSVVEVGPHLRLTFEGKPGFIYRFEASDDLIQWSFVTNSGPNSTIPGEIVVMDRKSTSATARFYRALSQ